MVYSDHEVGAETGSRPLVARVGHVGSPHQLPKVQPLRRHKCALASLNHIKLPCATLLDLLLGCRRFSPSIDHGCPKPRCRASPSASPAFERITSASVFEPRDTRPQPASAR